MIVVALPLPPSANRLWRQGRGRIYPSDEYKKWLTEAAWELKIQRARPIKGRVRLELLVSESSRIDLDNHLKPVADLLVKNKIIEGDSKKYVRGHRLDWDASVNGIRVTVTPTL